MNKSNTITKNLLQPILQEIFDICLFRFIITLAATRTSFTARPTTYTFNALFLLPYNIHYNCGKNSDSKCENNIIAYAHTVKPPDYCAIIFGFEFDFKSLSAFNLLSVCIIIVVIIPAMQATTAKPGIKALPSEPVSISVPI